MGFTISDGTGFGLFGWIFLIAIGLCGVYALVIILVAGNDARNEVVEDENDKGHDDIVG